MASHVWSTKEWVDGLELTNCIVSALKVPATGQLEYLRELTESEVREYLKTANLLGLEPDLLKSLKKLRAPKPCRAVNLNITGLAGDIGNVAVDQEATVGQAKRAIEEELGIPAIAQRLLLGFVELVDSNMRVCTEGKTQDLMLIRRSDQQVSWLQELTYLSWAQMLGWLSNVSHEVRGDREVILAAVTRGGGALRYASDELKTDRDFVLLAVGLCHSGLALSHVAPELRADREVILTAASKNSTAFQYASEELRNNRDFVLEVMSVNGKALNHVSEELRADREIVLAACASAGPGVLRFAHPSLQKAACMVNDARRVSSISRRGGA